jgi:large subunit ribosomal protein L13
LKETRFDEQLAKDSRKIIVDAVKNMLPQNKFKDKRIARLIVYKNSEHKNTAQKPKEIKL